MKPFVVSLFTVLITLLVTAAARASGPVVWIFETDLTGAMNQRISMAERFDPKYRVLKPIPREAEVTTEAYLRHLMGDDYANPEAWPDFIFQTEKRKWETDFLLDLKRLSPKQTRLIHLENPEYRNSEFDLIANGVQYPRQPERNVIRPIAVPSWISAEKLAAEKARLTARGGKIIADPRPKIIVAVGGSSHENTYTTAYASDLGKRLRALSETFKPVLFISTSRRTPPEAIEILIKELQGREYYLYDWQRDAREKNPYLSWLAMADYVIVSGDSRSGLSDAAITGRPIYVHAPFGSTLLEHDRMIHEFYVRGYARPFTGKELRTWSYPPLDAGVSIAGEIRKRFICPEIFP